jgi:hypothetical protein
VLLASEGLAKKTNEMNKEPKKNKARRAMLVQSKVAQWQ